jgi:beta-lactamase regulating signal transducer with metallopeptidase domain
MESLSMQLIPLFDWLLRTTLQAAMLFCLIMLIKLIVRGRLPIRWHYCLWLLLLIRMASPWLPESKISVFNWVPRSVQHGGIVRSLSQPGNIDGMGFHMHGRVADEQEKESEAAIVTLAKMLPLLWLVGGAALAVYVGASNFRLWWLVTRERPLTDQKILDLLEDCKAEMGIRNMLGIVTTDKVSSAALFGFVRPRLLLPAGMVETLSRQELRYVFLHELGHLRRRDIYVGWLMSLLQIIHWFNPFVWLAFYRMQSDRELACDALVLSHARSGEHKEYGRTIVSLLERYSRPQRLPGMAGISENKSQLKRRIKMIAKFKKTSRTRGAGAMLLLTALACIVLTNAYVAKADFTFGTPSSLGPIVNSPVWDATPCISADGLELYFLSERAGGLGTGDIWVTKRASINDDWGPPENLGPPVNSSSWELNPYISRDGLTLYFASLRPGGYGADDLYMATRATKEDDWSNVVNLGPVVNSGHYEFGTCVSADGLELYFAAYQREGGFGELDLWVTTRETTDDDWGQPVNLGPTVNSSASESAPSLSNDGLTLFFSDHPIQVTPRPGGYGGTDIWVTTRATRGDPWGKPVNAGPTINSSANEDSPSISADGSILYFTSGQPGATGTWDIWQVRILPVVDLNGDGKVDMKDFRKLAQYWGQDEPSCDIAPLPNGDGIVDEKDLNLFAKHMLLELQPVAHWMLDEAEGEIAEDSFGNNDGVLNGNPVWQPAGGVAGGALQLDGVDDYVSTDFSLNPRTQSFSVFVWIKGAAPGQVIISQTGGQLGTRWLWTDPSYGRLLTWLMHPPFDPLMSESVITDDQWHHVGLVYDFDNYCRSIYVDAVEVAKDNEIVGGIASDGGLYLGADKMLQPGTFMSGLIDDIRIYDEVLSAEEVADMMR